jgi:hypothetical protein
MNKVEEVISYVITYCSSNPRLSKYFPTEVTEDGTPIRNKESTLYELRIFDDDSGSSEGDEDDSPLFALAALERDKHIGDFGTDTVALCKVKGYDKLLSMLSKSKRIQIKHRGRQRSRTDKSARDAYRIRCKSQFFIM